MSLEEERPTHIRSGEIAAIHASITTLSVNVGVLAAQLKALDDKVVHHMAVEHEDFDSALRVVNEMQKSIIQIQGSLSQQKGAWIAVAKLGALTAGAIGLLIGLFQLITHK